MATKTFKTMISKNQDDKRSTNLETENQRLRDKIKSLENDQHKEIALLKLSEISLASNIRNDEFNYEFEDIKNLAEDIKKNGQLQPVLISLDKYLIAGYRRYNALTYLHNDDKTSGEILAFTYPKKLGDISTDEIIDIQMAENIQRKEIDNFQLSNLYNQLLEQGSNQQQLSERFKKSKSLISMIVSIDKIAPEIKKLIKQFQIYGWSEQKFNALNFSETDNQSLIKEYEKIKGTMGISPLNRIAKHENLSEQKREFLNIFKKRLSEEELNSKYFSSIIFEEPKKSLKNEGLKYIQNLAKVLDNQNQKFLKSSEYASIKSKIDELENLLKNVKI